MTEAPGIEDGVAELLEEAGTDWRLAKGRRSSRDSAAGVGVTEALEEEGVGVALLLEGAAGRAMAEPRRERRVKLVNFIVMFDCLSQRGTV